MIRPSLLLAAVLAVAFPAVAGTVRTLDGKTYDGEVKFDPRGKVIVTPPGGQPVEIDFANLLHVTFGPSTSPPPQKPGEPPHGLMGVYYDSKDLSGKFVFRIDPVVDFNWQKGQPAAGIEGDAFTVRWSGKVEAPETGDYTFITRTNDGARLWVDGRQLYDHWLPPEGLKEWSGTIRLEKGKKADFRLEYMEQGGNAEAHLLWKGPNIPNPEVIPSKFLIPAPPPPPSAAAGGDASKSLGSGLLAIYYNSRDFSGQAVTRIDPKVEFEWNGPPVPGLGAENFSVRWIGQVRAPATEGFTFHTVTDDGVRLWINNQLIIDQWQDQSPSETSGTFPLKTGQLYDIRMEYYQGGGGAVAKLFWSSPSTPKQIIPQAHLVPVSGGAKLAAARSAPSSRMHSIQGLVLRSGSLIKGQVERADDSAVRYNRERERDLTVSTSTVAYIIPQQLPASMAAKIPPGRPGVLLKGGDFFEGDIRWIRDGRVRVSSVLFGLRDFGFWDCQAIVYHDPSIIPAPYEIRMSDGSVLMASAFTADKDYIVVKDISAGLLKVFGWEVQEIKCGGSRFQPLAETRLAKAEVPPGASLAEAIAVDVLPGGVMMWMDGQPVDRGIAVAGGTSLTYDLRGAYRVFHGKAGVLDGAAASARVRFVVLADGKEAWRSPERSPGEGAIEVAVNVADAKTLTLRVENAGPAESKPSAVWANPVLLKP
jgi:hypothetical protein